MPNRDEEFRELMMKQFHGEMPKDFAKKMRAQALNQMIGMVIIEPTPDSIERTRAWIDHQREQRRQEENTMSIAQERHTGWNPDFIITEMTPGDLYECEDGGVFVFIGKAWCGEQLAIWVCWVTNDNVPRMDRPHSMMIYEGREITEPLYVSAGVKFGESG